MSKTIVTSQAGNFAFTFSLVEKFIDVCPENIWVEKFGGWPVWQQLYHGLAVIDFFGMAEDGVPAEGLFEPAVAQFSPAPDRAPTRQEMKAYAATMKGRAKAYFDSLDDKKLGELNKGLTTRMNAQWTHASAVVMLSGHLLYHLGSCDAALRQHGLQGVF